MAQRTEGEKISLWLGDFPLQTLNYAGQPSFPLPEAGADHVDGSGLGHSLGDAEEHPNPKLRPGQWKKSELRKVCKHQHMPQVSSPGSESETQNFIISSHLKVWQKQSSCSDWESQHSISAAWDQEWTSVLQLNRPYSFFRPTTGVNWTFAVLSSLPSLLTCLWFPHTAILAACSLI